MNKEYHDDGPTETKADRRVILLSLARDPSAREMALALARGGHSLILWNAKGLDEEEILGLQLAIERAGGISLALSLDAARVLERAIDAFGHLDAAVAWEAAEAEQLKAAMDGFKKVQRPELIVAGETGSEGEIKTLLQKLGVQCPGESSE